MYSFHSLDGNDTRSVSATSRRRRFPDLLPVSPHGSGRISKSRRTRHYPHHHRWLSSSRSSNTNNYLMNTIRYIHTYIISNKRKSYTKWKNLWLVSRFAIVGIRQYKKIKINIRALFNNLS